MSQGKVTREERNAFVEYKEEQNERKVQHHDEVSQNLSVSRLNTLLLVIFALVGLSIYAFEQLDEKSEKLSVRSTDNHFHKAIAYELAADDRFEKSAVKLCRYIDGKGEIRSEYIKEAKRLGALLTAHWLENGCSGDCENLANSK